MPDPEQQSLNPQDNGQPQPDPQLHRTTGQNQPIFKDRINRVDIAIWKNEKGYSVQLQKSYKRKDNDEWTRMKISFFPDEIDGAIAVLTKAKEFLGSEGVKTFRVERE
jgi:hypothetical protein